MATAKPIAVKVTRRDPYWTWNPPASDATPAEYSRDIRANARRWASNPDALHLHPNTGELRCGYGRGYGRNDEGFTVGLSCTVGGGWGSSYVHTVAEWCGGKGWVIRDAARGRARDALDRLNLPETDGRLLVIGAPDRPAKGVTAWRKRWTVSRKDAAGLVAVAGEGINDASLRAKLKGHLANVTRLHGIAVRDAATLRAEHAELVETAPAVMARAAETIRLLYVFDVRGKDGSRVEWNAREATHVIQFERAYRQPQNPAKQVESQESLLARAADRLAHYAQLDSRPLAIGVRATRTDGRPNHAGPYSDAHKVGKPATAPDWRPGPACGNGLHYVPMQRDAGYVAYAADAVQHALSYANRNEYALWIVRAEAPDYRHPLDAPEAVMIDGHKAKARTLTPLERVGQYVHEDARGRRRNRNSPAVRAIETARQHAWNTEMALARAESNEHAAASYARDIRETRATLKAWRAKP